jgi:hypothetical protein
MKQRRYRRLLAVWFNHGSFGSGSRFRRLYLLSFCERQPLVFRFVQGLPQIALSLILLP